MRLLYKSFKKRVIKVIQGVASDTLCRTDSPQTIPLKHGYMQNWINVLLPEIFTQEKMRNESGSACKSQSLDIVSMFTLSCSTLEKGH